MKKFILVLIYAFLCSGMALSAGTKDALRFRKDGTFRIMQVTDSHIGNTSEGRYQTALEIYRMLSETLAAETPDLVVFTGDIVTAGRVRPLWNTLMDTLAVHKIPFAVVFGNHDPEEDLSRAEMSEIIAASPYSLNTLNAKGELADIEIPILPYNGETPVAAVYCLDSQDYSQMKGVDGYGWFTRQQVDWLYDSCVNMAAKAGETIPSLAFFHIPLPEYVSAWEKRDENGFGYVGDKREPECPSDINQGMFAAMLESGSVMGMFVGHDHTNDYVVADNGIAMAYGCRTTTGVEYPFRMIVLKEGKRQFETWKRKEDGTPSERCVFKKGKIKALN